MLGAPPPSQPPACRRRRAGLAAPARPRRLAAPQLQRRPVLPCRPAAATPPFLASPNPDSGLSPASANGASAPPLPYPPHKSGLVPLPRSVTLAGPVELAGPVDVRSTLAPAAIYEAVRGGGQCWPQEGEKTSYVSTCMVSGGRRGACPAGHPQAEVHGFCLCGR